MQQPKWNRTFGDSLNDFFWKSAGSDPLKVIKLDSTRRHKHFLFGFFVVFSGFLTAVSFSYASYLSFGSFWVAVLLGVFFGLIIYNAYRFIILSVGHLIGLGTTKKESVLSIAPRFVYATIIGYVVSKPLQLLLFSSGIYSYQAEFTDKKIHFQDSLLTVKYFEIEDNTNRITSLSDEIKNKKKSLKTVVNRLDTISLIENELLYKQLSSRKVVLSAELTEVQVQNKVFIDSLKNRNTKLNKQKLEERKKVKAKVEGSFSLLNQIGILHNNYPYAWLLTIAIVCFFVLPIFGKLNVGWISLVLFVILFICSIAFILAYFIVYFTQKGVT